MLSRSCLDTKKNQLFYTAVVSLFILGLVAMNLSLCKPNYNINTASKSTFFKTSKNGAESLEPYYDVCIAGAGLSGSVLAERYASQLNQKVLVVEK